MFIYGPWAASCIDIFDPILQMDLLIIVQCSGEIATASVVGCCLSGIYDSFCQTNPVEVFRNKPQHKNANIANFVLAVPLENNCTNGEYNFKM